VVLRVAPACKAIGAFGEHLLGVGYEPSYSLFYVRREAARQAS
jgi:hypothetical protein